jgi:hypothetical protein
MRNNDFLELGEDMDITNFPSWIKCGSYMDDVVIYASGHR